LAKCCSNASTSAGWRKKIVSFTMDGLSVTGRKEGAFTNRGVGYPDSLSRTGGSKVLVTLVCSMPVTPSACVPNHECTHLSRTHVMGASVSLRRCGWDFWRGRGVADGQGGGRQ